MEFTILVPDVEVYFVFVEIVGDVVDGVVVGRVLVVDEDELVVRVLDQDVVSEEVIVREDEW